MPTVDRNAILQNLENQEVLAAFDDVTRDDFKLGPYLEKGFIEGDIVKYSSGERGGSFEYREKGLSYEEKRALTGSPINEERFKLKHMVTTEVIGSTIIKQAISDPKISGKILENKIGGLATGVSERMWEEFVEKICKYNGTLYTDTAQEWLHPSSRKTHTDKFYYGEAGKAPKIDPNTGQLSAPIDSAQWKIDVLKFEQDLEKSTYRPQQIIIKDLAKVKQKEFAEVMTRLIAGVSEGKNNTRAGNKAKCKISEVLMVVDWGVSSTVEVALRSPMVNYSLMNQVLAIIPADLDNNFQVVGMAKKTIKCTWAIDEIRTESWGDTLKTTVYKHDKYHIDLSSRNPLMAIKSV